MKRIESDLIGSLEVPAEALYGVQTLRGIENFPISCFHLCDYPLFVNALAITKLGAAKANYQLGLLTDEQYKGITQACEEILAGQHHDQFPVDMIQGGAGTTTNMNANEVIANRALQIMVHQPGEYQYCSPNDHVNCSQSTNDAYPTAIHIGLYATHLKFMEHYQQLIGSFEKKAVEFADIIKMGRTQLEDAVPMTLGQTFGAFASILKDEIRNINFAAEEFLTVNMGATAIGTGITAEPEYSRICTDYMREIAGLDIKLSRNLIEATHDTSCMVAYSSALKSTAIRLSKICNDLRLMSSGPRTGLSEINLPPKQPGSSIMPGKVNPVIPEVVNQVCFKVIGNDMTVTMASEAAQLELNVMEPVLIQSLVESAIWMSRAFTTLRVECIEGITANKKHCEDMVKNSIGIVTALKPYIGYAHCTDVAKTALETGASVYDLVLERNLLTKKQLDRILDPKNMVKPAVVEELEK